MSDLHCAATLLLVPVEQAPGVAGTLTTARIAHVWSGTEALTLQAAEKAAAGLGVGTTTRSELDDPEEMDTVLAEIADEHRGETVIVVVGAGDAVTEVIIDSDGLERRAWGGGPG
jgi:hypothetical protein